MFILKKGHQPGVYVPLRALFLVILAGKEDNHNISDDFEFQPDSTKDCGVSCPLASEKIPIDL